MREGADCSTSGARIFLHTYVYLCIWSFADFPLFCVYLLRDLQTNLVSGCRLYTDPMPLTWYPCTYCMCTSADYMGACIGTSAGNMDLEPGTGDGKPGTHDCAVKCMCVHARL